MTARTDADVEALLRRTYEAVASRTVVDPAPDVGLRALPAVSADTPQWRRLSIAAATVALLVGGLVVLAGRGGGAPADGSQLVHAVASWVPQVARPEGGAATFPVREIVSTPTYDRLVWASQDAAVTLEVDRASTAPAPAGEQVVVRRSIDAVRSEAVDGGALRWSERPGVDVTIRWSGDVDDRMIDDVASGLFFVDDATWASVVDRGGFRESPDDPLDERVVEAGRRVDVRLVGSLHEGYHLQVGAGGSRLIDDTCSADVVLGDRPGPESQPTAYLVRGPGDVSEAVVSIAGESTVTVPLVPVFPGVDVAIGTVELDRPPSAPLPTVTCGEGK